MQSLFQGCAGAAIGKCLMAGSLVALCIVSASCSTGQGSARGLEPTAAAADNGFNPPTSLKWFNMAAERQALQAQGYRYAALRVAELAPDSGRWAIVLDADETILDNSAYQERIAKGKLPGWSQETWDKWVEEKASPAFPSAKEFLEDVRRKYPNALIAIVTNRTEETCDETAEVLTGKVPYDALLCAPLKPDGKPDGNKQPRFDRVASGEAFKTDGPVKVVLYVGDNIKDCPGQTQNSFDTQKFGESCIVLPNPMYGPDWEFAPYKPIEL